jgi:hypothetical protein
VNVRLAAKTSVRNERFIEFVKGEVSVFIKEIFPFTRLINSATTGLNEGKKLSGGSAISRVETSVFQILQNL